MSSFSSVFSHLIHTYYLSLSLSLSLSLLRGTKYPQVFYTINKGGRGLKRRIREEKSGGLIIVWGRLIHGQNEDNGLPTSLDCRKRKISRYTFKIYAITAVVTQPCRHSVYFNLKYKRSKYKQWCCNAATYLGRHSVYFNLKYRRKKYKRCSCNAATN